MITLDQQLGYDTPAHAGQDPFRDTKAEAAAKVANQRRADMAAALPPPPAPKPSLVSKMKSFFVRQVDSGRERYFPLVKKYHTTSKDLSATEMKQLHEAMGEAGFTEGDLDKHCQMLVRRDQLRGSAAKFTEARKKQQAATQKVRDAIAAIQKAQEDHRLAEYHLPSSSIACSIAEKEATEFTMLDAQCQELFGE